MTPKEQYEARKTERKAEREKIAADKDADDKMPMVMLDMADRLVTAIERIADALESQPAATASWPGKGIG